jgi:hypothetical protein
VAIDEAEERTGVEFRTERQGEQQRIPDLLGTGRLGEPVSEGRAARWVIRYARRDRGPTAWASMRPCPSSAASSR